MTPILFDLTEFMAAPLRTGIQRVSFEILARWPGPVPLQPVRVDEAGRLVPLPPETAEAMTHFFRAVRHEHAAARERLVELGRRATASLDDDTLLGYPALLNPELFFAPTRLAFYERLADRMADRIFFVVHDFLPQLAPGYFAKGGILHTLPYVRLLRSLRRLAFVSEATRRDYRERIARGRAPDGPVLTWGADGLGTAEPSFVPARRGFTTVGTLEPRKNTGALLRAFDALWHSDTEVTLTLIGRYAHLEDEDRKLLDRLTRNELRFRWLTDQDDAAVRDAIRGSRATVFPSLAEGFGIPPLESLALGVPVIVSAGVPSVAMLPPLGQIRLAEPTAAAIRQAVLEMLDDDVARRKCEEIPRLQLPTWDGLARQVAGWVGGRATEPTIYKTLAV